ncbi:MAG: choice-of-anchor X domain-containing protein, partial [bacterium]
MEDNIKNKKCLTVLISLLLYLSLTNVAYGVVWPNTPGGGRTYPEGLSSDYGPRGTADFHRGLDFPDDPNVKAVEAGRVCTATLPLIIIYGAHTVRYYHMATRTVNIGDYVTEGQKIGEYRTADAHVDIKLSTFTNPLRDLFSSLYTSSTPSIQDATLTGDVEFKDGKYYINQDSEDVTIDTYIETNTKDSDVIEFSLNPSISGFPIKFDYHNWSIQTGMRYNSYTDKYSPAEDHFYYDWDVSSVPEGEYTLTISATDVNGNQDSETLDLIIDRTPPIIDDIKFYEHLTDEKLLEDRLYGGIDIEVEAHDPDDSLMRVTGIVYALYNPQDAFLSSLLFPEQIVTVEEILNYISTNNIQLPIIYSSQEILPMSLYWNTTATTYWDGPYLLKVEVEDLAGNTKTTHRFIRVDNNAPHLDIVETYQMEPFDMKKKNEKQHVKSKCLEKMEKDKLAKPEEIKEIYIKEQRELEGYHRKYSACWNEINGGRELKVFLKEPLKRGVETKFLLLFSQPVQIKSAFIHPQSNMNNRIPLKLNSQDENLNYYISDAVIIPSSTDWDGEVMLNISAHDVNWNNLDRDPRTIAVRDDEFGFHEGYEEGSDMNHSFELPPAPAAPSNLTTEVIIQHTQPQWINLYWQDNAQDEDGFVIFRRKDGEKNYSLEVRINSPNVNRIERIIPPEQGVYFYTVMAFKKQSGYSKPSVEQMTAFVPGGEETDLEPPGGRIIYDQEGLCVKGSVSIKVKVWDNVGVQKVEFYCSSKGEEYFIGESSYFFHTPEGTFTIYEWDSSSLGKVGDGIFCYIRDYRNNHAISENVWPILIDNIPPTAISDLRVSPDTWTGINFFNLNWDDAQDYESYVEKYYYSLNSSPQENSSFTLSSFIPELFLDKDATSGVYTIYITPKDVAGNIGPISKGLLLYDISVPIITAQQATPDIVFASETVKFTARVEDIHSGVQWVIISTSLIGLQDMVMYDDGMNGDEVENDGIYTIQATIPNDTRRGVYNLVVTAYDNCTNIATSTITLRIEKPDDTPPTITDQQVTPEIVNVGDGVKFTAKVEDTGSGVKSVIIDLFAINGSSIQQMYDDGTNGDEIANDEIYTYKTTIPKSVSLGMKKLIITAEDNVSNISKGTITLQVINPRITSVLPTSGTVGTIVTIKGEGYLPSEQIRIDFGTTLTICLATANTQGSFTATFMVDSQPYGTKTITATGVLSNTPAEAIFVLLDSLPPTIVNPHAIPEIVKIDKQVKLTAGVTDDYSGVKAVYIDLTPIEGSPNQSMFDDGTNGDEIANDGIYTYKTTIPNSVPYGVKNLVITAADIVSNISRGTITLQVINPKITSVNPTSGTIGTEVTLKGEGYLANEQIQIDFGATLTICLTTTNAQGSFTATFTVDSQPPGLKTIRATGIVSGISVEVRFDTGQTYLADSKIEPENPTTVQIITFRVTYFDTEGKLPKVWYPKVYIYLGKQLFLSTHMMPKDYRDTNPIDGKEYYVPIRLPLAGTYTHKFEAFNVDNRIAVGSPTVRQTGPVVTGVNRPPTLYWVYEEGYIADGVNPNSGKPGNMFTYKVKYQDYNNDSPMPGYPKVYIYNQNDTLFAVATMTLESGEGDWFTGAVYVYATNKFTTAGWYKYKFEAKDIYGADAGGAPIWKRIGPAITGNAPVLSWTGEPGYEIDGLNPEYTSPNSLYTYRIKYSDADGDPPYGDRVYVSIYKNGKLYYLLPLMHKCGSNYKEGVIFSQTYYLFRPGIYSYKFEAKDKWGVSAIGTPTYLLSVGPIISNPPQLLWAELNFEYLVDGVDPDKGAQGQVFTYIVKYSDPDNDPPLLGYPKLHIFKDDKPIEGSPFIMEHYDVSDTDYNNGKLYKKEITLHELGDYSYRFEAKDIHGIEAKALRLYLEPKIDSGGMIEDILDVRFTIHHYDISDEKAISGRLSKEEIELFGTETLALIGTEFKYKFRNEEDILTYIQELEKKARSSSPLDVKRGPRLSRPPVLSFATSTPYNGTSGVNIFEGQAPISVTYKVIYTDYDNDPPFGGVNVYILRNGAGYPADGVPYPLVPSPPFVYSNGVVYSRV